MEMQVHLVQSSLSVSSTRMAQIVKETEADETCQIIKQLIKRKYHQEVVNSFPAEVKKFYPVLSEITESSGLLMKGSRIIIPMKLHEDILKQIHCGHMGRDKCLARARETVYWPEINKQIIDMVASCSICLQNKPSLIRESIISHAVPNLPWQQVAMDLFEIDGQQYLIIADYFSRYPDVYKLTDTGAISIINCLKGVFSRFGIPQVCISDNGPQFNNHQFTKFMQEWEIIHKTSSPGYAQSNGFIEAMVKAIKNLLIKAKMEGLDWNLALLEYRNTCTNGLDSPALLMMN